MTPRLLFTSYKFYSYFFFPYQKCACSSKYSSTHFVLEKLLISSWRKPRNWNARLLLANATPNCTLNTWNYTSLTSALNTVNQSLYSSLLQNLPVVSTETKDHRSFGSSSSQFHITRNCLHLNNNLLEPVFIFFFLLWACNQMADHSGASTHVHESKTIFCVMNSYNFQHQRTTMPEDVQHIYTILKQYLRKPNQQQCQLSHVATRATKISARRFCLPLPYADQSFFYFYEHINCQEYAIGRFRRGC